MSNTMDPKHIETIDNLVSGYKKAKNLYTENAAMIRNLKAWLKEHKTMIIIVAIILGVIGYYVFKQYQGSKEEVTGTSKKTSANGKTAVVMPENGDLSEEEEPDENSEI